MEKLQNSLLSEAHSEAERIVKSAQAQAKTILDEEHSKSQALLASAEAEVSKTLEEQKSERMAWARLESKRLLSAAKEDAIESVLEEFFGSLEKLKKSPEYKKFIKNSVDSAAKELGESVNVHILPSDKDLVLKSKSVSVVTDLEGLGGVIVERSDGKVCVNRTLETLFETKRDEVRKQAYDRLFGGK
ncbi:hypothetical protein HZC07_00570 [Candidatus Micrarchaeota archaeon]|nr:hypothetical protein [Candidatus Micrarchaeota archaeon]